MPDNKKNVGKQDRIRVNRGEPYEVAYTAKKTGTTPAQVRAAAKKVGPMRKDVEAELKKAGKSKPKR